MTRADGLVCFGGQGVKLAFPSSFDAGFYRKLHADLVAFSDEQARDHYEAHGRAEGRRASPAALRDGFLTAIPASVRALEIGPFFSPVLKGESISYFDVMDSDGLRRRAKDLGHPLENVPAHIHFVSGDGDLTAIVAQFDLVLSSHCIEHQPNLVRHLNEVRDLLAPGGVFALIVPDRRYCFDALMAPSTIAEVLEASLEDRRLHRPASVIEHLALTTHNDPARHWRGDHGDVGDPAARARKALEVWRLHEGRYVDVHAWRFDPRSFAVICETLFEMDLSPLRVARVYDTPYGAMEFCAALERPE